MELGEQTTEVRRKLAVEFQNNLEPIKQKSSRAKKTCRGLVGYFTERINIELNYAQKLSALARTGGVSMGFSVIEYKNYEEM